MNTTSKGDAFERRVHDYFLAQIKGEQFHVRSSCCKVFHKKGYYSRDRGSDIEFDVSIEIYLPGATEYSEVWLIECKNYSHSVPVNDVEEFFAKVQQVSPTSAKPVMASSAAFQSGALNFAKAKKMGVLRFTDASDAKWELYRSPSASALSASEGTYEGILKELSSQEFGGSAFDLYMQSPEGPTNSLWDFAAGMLSESRLTDAQLHAIENPRGRPSHSVPYIEHGDLEERSLDILRDIGWRGGAVSLEDICSREAARCGLKVISDAAPEYGRLRQSALAQDLVLAARNTDIPATGPSRRSRALHIGARARPPPAFPWSAHVEGIVRRRGLHTEARSEYRGAWRRQNGVPSERVRVMPAHAKRLFRRRLPTDSGMAPHTEQGIWRAVPGRAALQLPELRPDDSRADGALRRIARRRHDQAGKPRAAARRPTPSVAAASVHLFRGNAKPCSRMTKIVHSND